MQVLVVEDEIKIARALRDGLEAARLAVSLAHNGEEGLQQVCARSFDLVVLDLMLPKLTGIELLSTMRRRGLSTPVIVLTARDAIEDRVRVLDSGADDYLVKPFAFPELMARIRALMRRGSRDPVLRYHVHDLELDVLRRQVLRKGRPLDLTAREFELLEYLLRHQSQIVSREMIARDIWRESARAVTLDNIIDVHVGRLRRKLDPGGAELIRTVRGIGFTVPGEAG